MSTRRYATRLFRNYYIFLRDFFRDLFDDKIGYYASSLSWSTIFAIIPLMVIMLWIFTTLPIFESAYKDIELLIFTNLMPSDSHAIMAHVDQYVENSDKLGIIGVGYVLFAVFMFFRNYDYVVNDIFETPKRNVWPAIKIYLLLLFIMPIFLGSSFYFSNIVQGALNKNDITQNIHIFEFLPFVVVWGLFYITYQISANTKISFQAAIVSSFISSLVWYLSKSLFVYYVLYNKTYDSIYGSISIVLFFFLWIYISWAIFLHGLKFCNLLDKDEDIERI